jgi:hypothetical protein
LIFIQNALEAKIILQFVEEVPEYFVKVEEVVQDSQTRKEMSRYQEYHYKRL